MRSKVFELILVSGVVLLCSCAHYKCDPEYAGPSQRSAELLEYYSYPEQKIEAEVEKISERKHYIVERIVFPSALNVFDNENIKIEFYVQKKAGKFPTILALPISGGIDFSVRGFAKLFASNGLNCAVVYNRRVDLDDTESAEEVEDYFRQTVLDSRQILDYLVGREEVDSDRLGCLGLSLGGIRASIVAGVDERLKCSVIGLAGGSIADINLLSDKKEIRKYMEELTEMGISSEIIYTELSDKVITDPLKLAQYVDARDVLMFTAMFDRVVPRKCCDQLREAIGKPEVVYLLSGHYGSFLYLPYAEWKSLSFFKKKFGIR
jgi:dienelactone hydrolase